LLDEIDKTKLNALVEACARLKEGFSCVVGPSDLFSYAIEELQKQFEIKEGIPGGKVIDMQTIDAYDVEQLADAPPPILYFFGFADIKVWEKIKIRRSRFIDKNIIVIFFLNPAQYRHLADDTASIASLMTATHYPLGAQRTLDDMGEDFQKRLHEVLSRIDKYEKKLNELIKKSPVDPSSDFLLVLRRWNSFSPILGRRPLLPEQEAEEVVWQQIRREIRGGGYFLRWKNVGVAIDPGHNFIENLYQTNHYINEINVIVITHDHLDHTSDFEAIIDLLYQCNKRGTPKKISVYLNPTTYRKFSRSLKLNRFISRIKKLKPDPVKYNVISKGIRLSSIFAHHKELGGLEEAVSLRFQLYTGRRGESISVGFTSDTGWHENLKPFFRDVELLVAHVGSIKRYEIEEAKFYPSHLGILGLFKILQEISESGGTPTVIISEFGEELRGLRDILGEELGRKFPGMKIFPADIGHLVELNPANIRILCGKNCSNTAKKFFEHNGEIQIRCLEHKPTLGTIGTID
jgi:ribonuclease BN (tRNA processing enzyme)